MKARLIIATLVVAVIVQAAAAAAPVRYVIGVGVWQSGGRVSTLEMVGLNPQPEPPSLTALAIYTSGASVVKIKITCAKVPQPGTYVATGRGTNGRFYLIKIVNLSTGRGGDRVGVASLAVPPSPCAETPTVPLLAGDFFVH